MIRRLFWLSTAAGAGYAGYMVWRWMRVQNKPSPTLEAALAGRLYEDVGVRPAAPVRPSADASSPEAPQPRRIVTRVHRGAPPSAPKSDAPDAAETAAAPVEDESVAPAETTAVPAEDESVALAEPSQDDSRTNINQADEATLVALPGIGPALARRIITYRDEHGPFASVEQLESVPGVRRNLDEFRHLVTV
ncbi:MAG: helix-hairpin-helix domain-containing protein [Chloroflexales bacterium]